MISEYDDDNYFVPAIEYALQHLLLSIVKQEDEPCSSYSHLATAISALNNLVPGFSMNIEDDSELYYVLTELLTMQNIKDGKITHDQGLKIMNELDIYNASKEV